MRNGLKVATAGALLALLAGAAGFAAELGRVEFQGKTIILSDDGTWKRADTADTAVNAVDPKGCENGIKVASARLPVGMCFDANVWSRETAGSGWEVLFRNREGTLYGGTITEVIALDEAFLRKAIIQNAADGAQVDVSKVKVLKEEKVPLNGQNWNHMEYTVPLGGTDFTYSNYYLTMPGKGEIQAVFFTTNALFEAGRPSIEKVVATLTVGGTDAPKAAATPAPAN